MKSKLQFFPITSYAIIMGLSGLTIVFGKFYHLQWLPKYLYDIFGDTVNIAARMEELASPMKANVSSASYDLLKDIFHFSEGTDVEMKGKGKQVIYTLLRGL